LVYKTVLLIAASASLCRAEAVIDDCCPRVEAIAGCPLQLEAAREFCKLACQKIAGFERLFDLRPGRTITIHVCCDIQDFRARSGKPWFVGAALVDDQIVTQPDRSLQKIENPEALVTHEMVHWIIRRAAGRGCPRWLDEGLAQWLAGQKSGLSSARIPNLPRDKQALRRLDATLGSSGSNRKDLETAYLSSLLLVNRLISCVGLEKLVAVLPELKKTSDPLAIKIEGKSLENLLFKGI